MNEAETLLGLALKFLFAVVNGADARTLLRLTSGQIPVERSQRATGGKYSGRVSDVTPDNSMRLINHR